METNDLMKTAERFKALKLPGMAQYLSDIATLPLQTRPTLMTMLNKIVEAEICIRDTMRTQRLLKASKLRHKVLIEQIDCSTVRNFTRDDMESRVDCGYIR